MAQALIFKARAIKSLIGAEQWDTKSIHIRRNSESLTMCSADLVHTGEDFEKQQAAINKTAGKNFLSRSSHGTLQPSGWFHIIKLHV